jgi:hypothetical protein
VLDAPRVGLAGNVDFHGPERFDRRGRRTRHPEP